MKAKWLRIGTPVVIICLLLLAALAYFPVLTSHLAKASSPTPSTGARHFNKIQMRLMSGFLANGLDDWSMLISHL